MIFRERQARNLTQQNHIIWILINFKESQYIEFYKLSHVWSKMDTCDHEHISTCIFWQQGKSTL